MKRIVCGTWQKISATIFVQDEADNSYWVFLKNESKCERIWFFTSKMLKLKVLDGLENAKDELKRKKLRETGKTLRKLLVSEISSAHILVIT